MMKLFPENASFDISDLSVDDMRYMIDLEMEHRKQVEAEVKRREAEARNSRRTNKRY